MKENSIGSILLNILTVCVLLHFYFYVKYLLSLGETHEYKLPATSVNVSLNRDELIESLPTVPQQPFEGKLLPAAGKQVL